MSSDEFSLRYSDLVTGSYDCVDRIVLNAFFPLGHNPGGFRVWWRRWHDDSDAELDNTHLMRLAGRFARRVKAWGAANDVPVTFCKAGERKHRIAEEFPSTRMIRSATCPTTHSTRRPRRKTCCPWGRAARRAPTVPTRASRGATTRAPCPVRCFRRSPTPRSAATSTWSPRSPVANPPTDSRAKPDLLAPGTVIVAARSSQSSPRQPETAFGGHYASVRNQHGIPRGGRRRSDRAAVLHRRSPTSRAVSAALVKATLINGATRIDAPLADDTRVGYPNFHQGFGRLNIRRAIPLAADAANGFSLRFADVNANDPEALNAAVPPKTVWKKRIQVAAGAPLSITLCWTDHPAHGLQNYFFDLLVQSPSDARITGNPDFTRPAWAKTDRFNNVERILVDDPEAGTWTIIVNASSPPVPAARLERRHHRIRPERPLLAAAGGMHEHGARRGQRYRRAQSEQARWLANEVGPQPIWVALAPEAHEPVHLAGIVGVVGDAVDLVAVIVLENEVAAVIAELHAGSVERHERRRAAGQLGVQLGRGRCGRSVANPSRGCGRWRSCRGPPPHGRGRCRSG